MGYGNVLVLQWLALQAFTAEGPGSMPSWGTKILQVAVCSQKPNKQKKDYVVTKTPSLT